MIDRAGPGEPAETRYILITQCLQNDFFLNRDCRLFLPDEVARTMLLGKQRFDFDQRDGSRRRLPRDVLETGPFGLFLEATIGRRRTGADGHGFLHVINIRDWHEPGNAYDTERRSYGPHCERGTWGASYLDGLAKYLDPGDSDVHEEARYFEEGSVRIHHVHADSLFDFKPRAAHIGAEERKFQKSALEVVLDVIVQGSDEDLERMRKLLLADGRPVAVYELAHEIDEDEAIRSTAGVYVAVIGVYTDLKVKTLLTGLASRYNLPNLAVSDTFTASATLERHLAGLDFAAKVLSIEVIHGINNLARFLGGKGDVENEDEIVAVDRFSRYESFFQDRQNVLAYQNEKLQDYLLLTERRAVDIYETIKRSNRFLIWWGGAFLTATLVLSILSAAFPDEVDWKLPAITAGVSLAQFLGAFFTTPMEDLQRNLANLAIFRMILESHSLKTAFARFHLTTPQTLRELQSEREATGAGRQVEALRKQLEVIEELERSDYENLERLGFRTDHATAAIGGASADGAPTTESGAPTAPPASDPS
jgi:hypothetical protein